MLLSTSRVRTEAPSKVFRRRGSGVGTEGSGGSINLTGAPELLRPRVVGPQKKIGKTLREIIKIVATRRRILRLKCTKFDFSWGSAPDPAAGSLQRSPDPLAGFGSRFSAGEGLG